MAPRQTDATTLRASGAQLQAAGRFADAAMAFQRLVALDPSDAESWVALSGALLVDRRPAAALDASEAGLLRLPASPSLLCAKARALQAVGRLHEARAELQRALGIDPDFVAARYGLALLAVGDGAFEVAATTAATMLALANPGPHVDWLAARIALGKGDKQTALQRSARSLTVAGLSAEQRAETLLLMGEALDGLGRPAEAFEAFRQGKAGLRAFYAERAASRESEVGKLGRLAAWFRAADPTPWHETPQPAAGSPDVRGHAFLVGFPRSGTTLLEQALAGHPELVALEEPPTLAEAYDAFLATPQGLGRLARLTAAEAAHWRAVYWRVVADLGVIAEGKVLLDKAPAGTLYLPLIAKLFPDAKILFAVRDPRDVTLSCFRNAFQMNALTYAFTDLTETARCYAAAMDLAAVYRQVLPIAPAEVRYERLVDDFEGELARIAGFLGLELTAGMIDVAATANRRTVRTPSAPQVRAGLNRRGLGRWRAYASELAPVMPILEPWIERLGYGGEG
jgi:tetratricopeptide (TPR) repeat protein